MQKEDNSPDCLATRDLLFLIRIFLFKHSGEGMGWPGSSCKTMRGGKEGLV